MRHSNGLERKPLSHAATIVRTPGTLTAPSSALTTPIRREEFLISKALAAFVPGKDTNVSNQDL